MGKIKILADYCCDLTPEQVRQHDITIIPLYVMLGDKVYRDRVDIQPQMIYEHFRKTGATPKTSAANVQDYLDVFRPFVEAGDELIYIGISLGFSCTVTNARLAAAEFPDAKIACIDSKNLSTGIGLLVLRAAEMAEAGLPFEEVVSKTETLTDYTRASFILEKLDYLRAGGRCSLLAAVGAQMLSIKPEIAVRGGLMSNRSKFRGSMTACGVKYASGLLENINQIDKRRAFVTYTEDTDPEIVDSVYQTALAANYFDEVVQSHAGCVVTSHCGRNTIGLLFIDKLPGE